ncbi:glycosyltransferase [Rhodococcus sp. X156]|uniref:glycosyltransferase n=1 Tax=Rhodococcus sp. X156 TaxID=2499145 RepID=UPI000FDA1D55|nr:glycosyltransferase [Rhodococcus sp. X156]
MSTPRLALVHERLTEVAGSENVVEQLNRQWPEARVHVPIARPEGIPAGLTHAPVTTWLDRLYRRSGQGSYAPLLPLLPGSFRRMPLREADVVITSHHAFATQVVHATDAPVIAYVHSPARWAWHAELRAGEAGGRLGELALTALAARTRRQELAAAPRLAHVVANSTAVAERVQQCWNRTAEVVYPPVNTSYYHPDPAVEREDFFLLAGRLVPYKRPDLAVRAAEVAGVRLVVAGDGRFLQRCQELAGPRTTFAGRVSDAALRDLHRRSRALVMPGVEDFGIVPVEAMACGSPVLALGSGGALDTVLPQVSGQLVAAGGDDQVVAALAEAMTGFRAGDYDPQVVRKHAERFSEDVFRTSMRDVVTRVTR